MNSNIIDEIVSLNLPLKYRISFYEMLDFQRRTIAVRKALQLAGMGIFSTRSQLVDEQGKEIGSTWIDYMWIVTISGWWAYGTIIIAGSRYLKYVDKRDVMQGVLLIPKENHNFDLFVGNDPFRCVDLPFEPDPVAQAILNLNIFEIESDVVPGNVISPSISIDIFNGNGRRRINYGGGPLDDPTWINLFDTLNQTTEKLRQLYNDPEIDSFFSAGLRREIE